MKTQATALPRRLLASAILAALCATSVSAHAAPTYQFRQAAPEIRKENPLPPPEPAAPAVAFLNSNGGPLSSLAFNDTSVGSNSDPVIVKVKNSGSAPLTLSSSPFAINGPFTVAEHDCPTQLPADSSCSATLVFSPLAFQVYTTTLELSSNAVDGNTLSVSGRGVAVGVADIVTSKFNSHTFVRKTDGSWSALGRNAFGQLGTGNTTNTSTFIPVPALKGASRLALGEYFTVAGFADNTWKAAGYNGTGALGLGHLNHQYNFVAVPGLTGASEVVAGGTFVLARTANGWSGAGSSAALGLGSAQNISSFTNLPPLAAATAVYAGNSHSLARLGNGTWVGTGNNSNGQLGLGHTSSLTAFQEIPGLAGVFEVVVGQNNTFARFAEGWAVTGANHQGQLGVGTLNNVSNFTLVPAVAEASQILPGVDFTLAKVGGNWRGAGSNWAGQLGISASTPTTTSFVPVPALTGASNVVVGGYHAYAKMADGLWHATGYNDFGQLGVGDWTSRATYTPMQY